MTNYDRIKEMTAGEFAEWLKERDFNVACETCAYEKLGECSGMSCRKGFEEWLKEEV